MTQQTNGKKLMSLDDIFGDIKEDKKDSLKEVTEVDIDLLVPYSNHPFNLYQGSRLDDMVKSIKEFGIIVPIIVRIFPMDKSKYEILAGHNRDNAAKLAGLKTVPIRLLENITDEEAMIIVTETNLMQRSFVELSHSEKAFILTHHHDSLKCQGKRLDLINEIRDIIKADDTRDETTFRPGGEKLYTDEKIGKEYDMSPRTVSRYIRINLLINDIKKLIDSEKIGIKAGVQLSYMSEDNQFFLIDILNNNEYKLDEEIATELRRLEKVQKLNEATMIKVIEGRYIKPKKATSILKGIKVAPKIMKKYFNEKQSTEEVENIIDKALELYYQNIK